MTILLSCLGTFLIGIAVGTRHNINLIRSLEQANDMMLASFKKMDAKIEAMKQSHRERGTIE